MPTFRKLSVEEIAATRRNRPGSVDLTEYIEFLRDITLGEGGELVLGEGDTQRTVKRRLSRAATRLSRTIRWRRSENGTLRFEVRAVS